jgi:hypothetical protein
MVLVTVCLVIVDVVMSCECGWNLLGLMVVCGRLTGGGVVGSIYVMMVCGRGYYMSGGCAVGSGYVMMTWLLRVWTWLCHVMIGRVRFDSDV